jgi:Ca2+-binding RTX toxin-like protein
MNRLWSAVVVAAALLALPAAALAAEVSRDGDTVTITDTAGIRDSLTVARAPAADPVANPAGVIYVFGYRGTPVTTTDPDCAPTYPSQIECGLSGVTQVVIDLGAGDDTLSYGGYTGVIAPLSTVARGIGAGGPGDDSMTGNGDLGVSFSGGGGDDDLAGQSTNASDGGGADTLRGGAGADTLVGSVGRDTMRAGGGNDAIYADAPGRDTDAVIDCGPGRADLLGSIDPTDPEPRGCERTR